MNYNRRKKRIIIFSIIVVIVMLIIFMIALFRNDSSNTTDEQSTTPADTSTTSSTSEVVEINALKEKASNLPDSRIELIEKYLFITIRDNLSSLDDINISDLDAVIRDGSFEQTLEDSSKQITFTTFIVDISSIKQSYRVNDYYSPFPSSVSGLFSRATLVLCPDASELIYGEFVCTDRVKQESGQ